MVINPIGMMASVILAGVSFFTLMVHLADGGKVSFNLICLAIIIISSPIFIGFSMNNKEDYFHYKDIYNYDSCTPEQKEKTGVNCVNWVGTCRSGLIKEELACVEEQVGRDQGIEYAVNFCYGQQLGYTVDKNNLEYCYRYLEDQFELKHYFKK
jgi:hypothetical protein